VRESGERVRVQHIELRTLAAGHSTPRVAVVVPRFSHSAVQRNRVKRRIREIVRRELLATFPPVDILVRAAPTAYGATHAELRTALLGAGARLRQVAR
jgi:ribonuclease P protein component